MAGLEFVGAAVTDGAALWQDSHNVTAVNEPNPRHPKPPTLVPLTLKPRCPSWEQCKLVLR
jgi:hypothetical protein